MVFAKYDFGTDMNCLDIIKQSKEVLADKVPAFNFIATDIPQEDYLEAKRILGDKMNTIIREQNPVRYTNIIEDYKAYMNAVDRFSENISEIANSGFGVLWLDTMDYDLPELVLRCLL